MTEVSPGMELRLDKCWEPSILDISALRYQLYHPLPLVSDLSDLQILGGRMAEYYGFKKLYGWGLLLTSIFSFLRKSSELKIITLLMNFSNQLELQ